MKKLLELGAALLGLIVPGTAMAQGHHPPHGGARGDHGAGHHHGAAHDPQRESGAKAQLGAEVQDFALADNAGKPFHLATLRRTGADKGKIVVLTFWCTTCMSCRAVDKDFDKKAKEYAPRGVHFVMVDSNFTDTATRVNQFLQEKGLSFPVLMDSDSKIARSFSATLTTTTAVIDAEGRLRYYGAFHKAEDAVRNLLAGEAVAVAESPAAG